jgi:tetratricopeptide (TPR) repeat protein
MTAMQQALELKPNDHRATLGLSRGLTLQGDIEGACAVLGDAMKGHGKRRSPQLAELQYGMAKIAEIAQDDEGRFAWLEAALQSDRKNGAVASELARFSMDRGDYDTAIKALQLVTLLKEDCPMSRAEAYLLQGKIFEARGDKRKAALLAKRALTADSEYTEAREFLNSLGL